MSRYSEFPPSMMMSPWSRSGAILSMKSSTAEPAFTSIMTRRGFFSFDTMSSRDLPPIMLVPEARGREDKERERMDRRRGRRGRRGREKEEGERKSGWRNKEQERRGHKGKKKG